MAIEYVYHRVVDSSGLRAGRLTQRKRFTLLGYPFAVWEPEMPRIDDGLFNCVIYLHPTESDAKAGERVGGTGFLVGVRSPQHDELLYPYAVTNSHVIREGASPVIRLNTLQGGFDVLTFDTGAWQHHPDGDDVAACSIDLSVAKHRFNVIGSQHFLTKEMAETIRLGPGDDAFMLGRFVNHEGKQRNLPTVRFGSISMMPWEPVLHPRGILQESFLVEMRSMSGYSGSPVFLLPDDPRIGYPWLLGVDWGHMPTFEPVLDTDKTKKAPVNWFVKSSTGMANVVPAWKVKELLDIDEFKAQRAAEDAEMQQRKERSPAELDVVADAMPAPSTER